MRIRLAIALTIFVAGCNSEQANQEKLETEAKAALDSRTRDPLAMQVRNVYAKTDRVLCGEVNLKNDQGQNAGFELFMADRATGESYVAHPTAIQNVMDEKVVNVCANAKQRRSFEQRFNVAMAEMNRELDEMNRESEIRRLKAEIAIRETLR